MNERIKQLAEQAKLPSYVLEYGTELCLAPHLEKFAELIVDEVYDYLFEEAYNGDPWPDRLEVKKHFGVEE